TRPPPSATPQRYPPIFADYSCKTTYIDHPAADLEPTRCGWGAILGAGSLGITVDSEARDRRWPGVRGARGLFPGALADTALSGAHGAPDRRAGHAGRSSRSAGTQPVEPEDRRRAVAAHRR